MNRAGAEEIRCPSCSRLLVFRTGPAITPHFAHRPRQSCRRRPGAAGVTSLRLEQLTLFDPTQLAGPSRAFDDDWAEFPVPAPGPRLPPNRRRSRRRRRRAWLPRLIRWIQARNEGVVRADRRSSAFTPETRGSAGPRR